VSDRPPRGATDQPATDQRDSDRRQDRLGWLLIALLTLGVLVTWAPTMTAALGDNHEGRILARHALNVANAQEDGLAASGWLSDWSPYVGGGGEQTSYAHHPPLMNLGYYLAGQLLPVDLDVAMRLFSTLLGAAMLPLGAAVLRRRGIPWLATVVATIAVAVTPLFWVYGRLHGNVTLLLAMTLLVVRVAEDRRIGRGELGAAAVVSVAAIVAGYLGMAMAALLGLWLLRRRGLDRITITVGVAMVVGAAISLGYVIGSTGAARIGEQVRMRTTGGGFTATEFLERIASWARALLPWWWRWLLLPASVVVGVWDRRTRPLTIMAVLVTIGYVVGLPNGSYIHDYWIFPVLLAVWFGAAALVMRGVALSPERERLVAGGLAAVLLVAGAVHGLGERIPGAYLTGPAAAGELVQTHGPATGQKQAWHMSALAAPRWLSLYWDLPPAEVTEDTAGAVPADDLVVVDLGAVPGWLGERASVREASAQVEGDYALLRGEALARLAAAG